MYGILVDQDNQVAQWAFSTYRLGPIQYERAFGIVDESGNLHSAALFHYSNGVNAHLSYYGSWTMTGGIIKALARIALHDLHLVRLTMVVPKKRTRLRKALNRLGFAVEGVQRRYYGDRDCAAHTGVRLVAFREMLEKLAGLRKAA